ncbi:hypothetical protein MPTK1_3g15990 [Marchantia polymorpha subsp. ruderalis]|uniref:Uncharacterized protein n=2 Tax=Marchantia polymorpha TaxID=3197 RepID=A0AAF6B1A8_MARPO|nr:hypothetical protein MARPO_0004s0073 [Marchantia polymorpha]BBN05792.1 hypothetical protein Mp_3g15990 [Marchantia polymorpha subsp. ruderalis]|eukprot:PTQ48786.1 hypothetical protein MARPO_0004s0073 [Marchantia polymorpha]
MHLCHFVSRESGTRECSENVFGRKGRVSVESFTIYTQSFRRGPERGQQTPGMPHARKRAVGTSFLFRTCMEERCLNSSIKRSVNCIFSSHY